MTEDGLRILIPLDYSCDSQAVIREIMTRGFCVPVVFKLLNVLVPFDPIEPSSSTDPVAWQSYVDGVREQGKVAAKQFLAVVSDEIQTRFPGSTIVPEIIDGHEPDSHIIEAALAWGADFIWIGNRGVSGIQQLLLGSVSFSVLLQSPCSIEVVRSPGIGSDATINGDIPKRIIVAIDDSEFSDTAMSFLPLQTWPEGSAVKLLTVLKPAPEIFGHQIGDVLGFDLFAQEKQTIEFAYARLNDRAAVLATKLNSEVKVTVEVRTGDTRESILKACEDWSAHLVVLGSHGRQGLARFFPGSVSQAIMLHAPCSVQIVKSMESARLGELQNTAKKQ